jgi:hypothetical protein
MVVLSAGEVARAQVDPITVQQAKRLLAQAAPHIDMVLGTKVVNSPDSLISSRIPPLPKLEFQAIADFRRAPDAALDALVHGHFPQLAGKPLERAQEAARDACGRVALAQYRPGCGTIVIAVPLDEQRIRSWSPVAFPDPPALAAERVLQLAIVHEVVRFHLDRQFHWSERLAKSRDEEEKQVLRGLVAGRAMQVTERVADRLGAAIYADLLAQRYRVVPEDGPDPERLAVAKAAVFKDAFQAATEGKAFFTHLAAQHLEDEKLVFSNPPHQAFWLSRPELYVKAVRQHTPSLKAVLAQLSCLPPAPHYAPLPQPLTPDMIVNVAAMLKEQNRAEALLRNWEEGHAAIWVVPGASGEGGQFVLSATRFSSPEAARAYHGFAIDLQRKRDEQMTSPCTATCKVLESKCTNVEMKNVAAAVRWTKKMQVGNAAPVATNMLYILAGNLVVEIDGFRVDPDVGWAQRVVEAIVGAHQTATANNPGGAR